MSRYILFSLLSVGFVTEHAWPAIDSDATALRPGQLVQRDIRHGESHEYLFSADKVGFWVVRVRQNHINTDLTVGNDTLPAIVVDSPTGRDGVDTVVFRVNGDGSVHIVVRAVSPIVREGEYELVVDRLSQSSALDLHYRKALQQLMKGDGQYRLELESAYSNAVEHYQEAIALTQDGIHNDLRARIHFSKAKALSRLGNIDAAVSGFQEAIELYLSVDDTDMFAWSNDELGLAYLYKSNYTQASDFFTKAKKSFDATGNAAASAIVQNNLCLVLHYRGDYPSALNCYRPVLGLLETMGELSYLALLHNNVGRVLDLNGEPVEARRHLTQALRLFEQDEDRGQQGRALNNLGLLERRLGNLQDAIRTYGQALRIQNALGNTLERATLLHNIGLAYHYLGDEKRGLRYLQRALPLRREAGDLRGEASTTSGLGYVLLRLNRGAEAAEQYRRSIDLRLRIDDKPGRARAFLRLGESLAASGDRIGALESINRAHELLVEAGDKRYIAESLFRRAVVRAVDDRDAAASDLREAKRLWASMNEPLGPARANLELANLALTNNKPDAALSFLDDSIAQTNAVRQQILAPTLRGTFLGIRQDAFRRKIEVLMRLHRLRPHERFDRAALIVNDDRLARSLSDLMFVRNLGLNQAADNDKAGQIRDLRDRVSARAAQLSRLTALDAATARIDTTRKSLDDLLAELDIVEGDRQGNKARLSALRAPRSIDIGEVQAALDSDTLILHLYVGEEAGRVWAIDHTEIHSYQLPSRSELDELVRESYADISRIKIGADCDPMSPIGRLGNVLLRPIADRLKHYPRLIVVADGSLTYVPFSVLPDPGNPGGNEPGVFGCYRPLVVSHEVRYAPSLAVWSMARNTTAPPVRDATRIAVFSDPVYALDDDRLHPLRLNAGTSNPDNPAADEFRVLSLPRLRWSATEAGAIVAAAGEKLAHLFTGFESLKARLLRGDMTDYGIIHLAVHGLYDTETPDLTSLVFSQYGPGGKPLDGHLTLQDVLGMQLHLQLLVLSGCDTALGEQIGGEGLVGMTRAMMYAGVDQIIASLWSVDDAATAALMSHFYRALITDHLPPAAALRHAQLTVLSIPKWRNPFYWGGFIIQGEQPLQ